MIKIVFGLVVAICLLSTQLYAEEIGVIKVNPNETKTFSYSSNVGQVFSFKVQNGPKLPAGQRGLQFGWDKQSVFCEGENCSKAGGYLLFCPKAGTITGELKNSSSVEFEVKVERVECEGKDAGTMRCPKLTTVTAMCR